jgi:hypothetical protein
MEYANLRVHFTRYRAKDIFNDTWVKAKNGIVFPV